MLCFTSRYTCINETRTVYGVDQKLEIIYRQIPDELLTGRTQHWHDQQADIDLGRKEIYVYIVYL